MVTLSKAGERYLIFRADRIARYSYIFFSLADCTTTILDRTLIGTEEATPVYRQIMANLGDGPGFVVCLCLEYLLIFGVHNIFPRYLRPLVFIIPAYIHGMGSLAHFDLLTRNLPPGVHFIVWANVRGLNDFGHTLASNAWHWYTSLNHIMH
jgi:hypothetical protein